MFSQELIEPDKNSVQYTVEKLQLKIEEMYRTNELLQNALLKENEDLKSFISKQKNFPIFSLMPTAFMT